jgi:hypothetical protein
MEAASRAAWSRGRTGESSARGDQGGGLDAVEERPGVDRLSGGIGGRVEAVEPAPAALRHTLPGEVLEQGRVGHRVSGEETEGADGVLHGRMVAQGALAAPVHEHQPVVGDGRPGVDDDEAAHPLRVPGGERHGVVPTHGVADDNHVPPAERIHHRHQVAREVLGAVARRVGPVAQAVASLIERDEMKPILEGRRYLIEPVGVGGAPVQEAQGGAAGGAPLEQVER